MYSIDKELYRMYQDDKVEDSVIDKVDFYDNIYPQSMTHFFVLNNYVKLK